MTDIHFKSTDGLQVAKLLKILKNNKAFKKQREVIKTFFNFDTLTQSKANLKALRHAVASGNAIFTDRLSDPKKAGDFRVLNVPSSLIDAEQAIFKKVIALLTLKHATDQIDPIIESGKMYAARDLKQQGVKSAQHTPHLKGLDRSLYFVLGLGAHKTPPFLNTATHTITIALTKLAEKNPEAMGRLWVSGHSSDYESETKTCLKLGGVKLEISHSKDYTKQYKIIYENGGTLDWKVNFADEVFAANDVAPGLAFQFILMLRLLGGSENPLVNKLYHAVDNESDFTALLENMFTTLFPGFIYPEAKIVSELTLDNDYVSIEKNQHQSTSDYTEYNAIDQAIKKSNVTLLAAILKSNFTCNKLRSAALYMQVAKLENARTRLKMYQLLNDYGFSVMQSDGRDQIVGLHEVIKNGRFEDLAYLINLESVDQKEPHIHILANPNPTCGSGKWLDVAEMCCGYDRSGKSLRLLQEHGVDFKKHANAYVIAALGNPETLKFLGNCGVDINDEIIYNETPLMLAAKHGDLASVKFLIETLHADVNYQFKGRMVSCLLGEIYAHPQNGQTALHFAAAASKVEIIEYLLSQGANNLSADNGKLACDLVPKKSKHYDKLSQLLKSDNQAKINHAIKPILHDKCVAVLLTGKRADGKPYIVLGKRYMDKALQSCAYSFPGGGAEQKDGSLLDAALRELREETGIDVTSLPNAQIKELMTVSDLNKINQAATSFFWVDIGNASIKVNACDDLISADKILIEDLVFNEDKPVAKQCTYKGVPIQGSNALIIKYLLDNHNVLSESQIKTVSDQVHIEEHGYTLLLEMLAKNKTDFIPGSLTWQRFEALLANEAHHSKESHSQSITIAMMDANPLFGLPLLSKYGVDFNDSRERGIYIKNNELYPANSLQYAAKLNRMDIFKMLLSLGAVFAERNTIEFLEAAAETGNADFILAALDLGVDANQSYDYRGEPDSRLIRPVISEAIKHGHNNCVAALIADGRILLNRERSAKLRYDALMKAIYHDNLDATFRLLASFRMNLSYRNKTIKDHSRTGKHEHIKSAKEIAKEKKYNNVLKVIEFLERYPSMATFMAKHHYPGINHFAYSFDEDNRPTIHFFSKDQNELLKLCRDLNVTCQIRQSGDYYYIRLGQYRLTKLINDSDVVEFLLQYCQNSIFWDEDNLSLQILSKRLRANELRVLNAALFNKEADFHKISNKNYYAQLIAESVGIKKVSLNLSYSNPNVVIWLQHAIAGHDKITELTLSCDKNAMVDAKLLNESFKTIAQLPNLSTINLSNLSLPIVLEYLKFCHANFVLPHLTIKIKGGYSQSEYDELLSFLKCERIVQDITLPYAPKHMQTELNSLMLGYMTKHLMQTDKSFMNEINQLQAKKLVLHDDNFARNRFVNKLYRKNVYRYAHPTDLTLLCGPIDQEDSRSLNQFIQENTTLKYLKLDKDALNTLTAFEKSNAKLTRLDLEYCEFKSDAMLESLTTICRTKPLEILNIYAIDLTHCSECSVRQFFNVLKNMSYLKIISCDQIRFANKKLATDMLLQLAKSHSIISAITGDGSYSPYTKEDVNTLNQALTSRVKDQIAASTKSSLWQASTETNVKNNTLNVQGCALS